MKGNEWKWPGRMDEGWMDDGGSQNTMGAVKSLFLSKPSNHSSTADCISSKPLAYPQPAHEQPPRRSRHKHHIL